MKKTLCAILSAVVLFTGVLATPVRAEAIEPISIAVGIITSMVTNALSNFIADASNRDAYRQQMREAFGNSAFDGVATVTADDLWGAYAQLNSQHVPVEIHSFTYNGVTYYGLMGVGVISYPNGSVLAGTGVDITNQWMQYTYLSGNVPMFLRVGSQHLPSNTYQYYNYNLLQGISSFVQSISTGMSILSNKLDNIYSALTGQSSVMADARSIIEQLSVYTSTSDLSTAAKQYWSRTFVDPASNFSMVYVTYEDLTQLVTDLANIGVTTRIYYDEAKGVYVIRDVGAWIVDPNTRSDYYSSSAAPEAVYHFYQHYFSLGRGQVICSTFPSLSLLLNDLNLRIVTVWNSIENGFSSLDNSISSLGDDVSAILDFLTDHEPYEPPFYVKNYYAAGSLTRPIPYDSAIQIIADINVNYIDYPCQILDVGEGFLVSSVHTYSSFAQPDNASYPILVYYREAVSGNEELGVLCDSSGRVYRAYQMDNYPFRILNKLNDIYDWLDSADLITSDDIDEMVEKSNSKVYKFLKFTNRFLGVFNDVFDFDLSLSDWSSIHEYLSQTGRD